MLPHGTTTALAALDDQAKIAALEQINMNLSRELESNPRWGNAIASGVWDTVTVFVLDMIITQLEEAFVGANLTDLKFDRQASSLGHKPVQWKDIRIVQGTDKNLALHGTLDWKGDLSIRMTYRGIPVGIRNLSVHGAMMIELVGMLETLPLFDGGRFFFFDQPALSLEFEGVGEVLNMLGSVKTKVLRIVTDTISRSMVLPARFGMRVNPSASYFSITHPPLEGVLWLGIAKATDLLAMDTNFASANSSDPYIEVRLGALRFVSPTVYACLSPTFNYLVPLVVALADAQTVHIRLWDKDFMSDDDFLGKISFPVKEIIAAYPKFGSVDLCDTDGNAGKNGRITIQAVWRPLRSDPVPDASENYVEVIAGVQSACFVPRAGHTNTTFWVRVECTNLLEGQAAGPQETMAYLPPKPPGDDQDRKEQREILRDKIRILRSRGLPDEDIALALDVPDNILRRIASDGTPHSNKCYGDLLASSGRCDISFLEAFRYLVKSPSSVKLTFTLKTKDLGTAQVNDIGKVSLRLQEALDKMQKVGDRREYIARLRVPQTSIVLHIEMKAAYFDSSGIRFD